MKRNAQRAAAVQPALISIENNGVHYVRSMGGNEGSKQ